MDDRHAGLKGDSLTDSRRERAALDAATAHPDRYRGSSPIQVRKLGHFVYEVSDIERSVRFWTEVLGFTESDRNARGMVFLRCNSDHHGIGLKPSSKKRRADASAGMCVEHLAFEVADTDTLLKARAYLRENNIPIVFEGRKGAGCNIAINFLDPDGYEFELYCCLDQVDESGRTRPESQFRPVQTLEEAIAKPVPKTW